MPATTAPAASPIRSTLPSSEAVLDLRDGRRVALAPIGPVDGSALADFYCGLSTGSRRLRFLQAMPTVSDRLARQLADVDQDGHVAWAAWREGRIVGEARYVRLRDEPAAAEVAFAVAEDHRRVGLARQLVESLGVIAREQAVTTFTSTVADENRASSALLRAFGTSFVWQDGAFEGRGAVPPWTGSPSVAGALIAAHHDVRHLALGAAA